MNFPERRKAGTTQAHCLETELLASMLAKKRFAMKSKNFKDDPAFKEKDNERRLVLPSSKLSKDAAEALEKHFRETRTGISCIHAVCGRFQKLCFSINFQVCKPGIARFATFTLSHSSTPPQV